MSNDEALEIIANDNGKLFDPVLAKRFISFMKSRQTS